MQGEMQAEGVLCCQTIGNQAPDMVILDDPTNKLNIQDVQILATTINRCCGTAQMVSHDEYFLRRINVDHSIAIR